MYKLTYKGQFVDGFDADQVVGNLAQLLNLKPKAVRLAFLSERPSVIKMLDSASEVERWCAAFQEAGVYLDVMGVDSPDEESIADQIELELELHALDLGDEEEPDERQYLIRKVISPDLDSDPQTFANQPLATRALSEYPIDVIPAAKPMPPVNGNAINGHAVNGAAANETAVNGQAVNGRAQQTGKNGAHQNGEHPNGTHKSVVAAADPIEVTPSNPQTAALTQKTVNTAKPQAPAKVAAEKPAPVTKSVPVATPVPQVAVDAVEVGAVSPPELHELSVAKIDALAAQQQLDEAAASIVSSAEVPPGTVADERAAPAPQVSVSAQPAEGKKAAAMASLAPTALIADAPARVDHDDIEALAEVPLLDDGLITDDQLTDEELDLGDEQLDEDFDEDVYEEVNFHKSHFVWGMLVILLAIIATAGTILWLKRSTWTPVTVAPQEQKITEAIASSTLFGMVHADVDRLQLLSPSTDVFAQLTEPKAGFWSGLSGAGVDIKHEVDDLWVGVYGQNNQTKVLWVLQGNFSAAAWGDWLKKNYTIDSDTPDALIFSSMDEFSCEKSPVMSASISNNQIVLGAPELVAAFNGRMQAGAAPEKNLETWAKGYNTQMVSAVLFHPGQLPEGSAAMALGKLSLPAEPIQGIYLGLEPKMFPPAVKFDALIASDNQQFLTDASAKLTAATSLAKTSMATDWPETLALYERIKLVQEPNQLHASLNLDNQAPQQIQTWVSSLLTRAFGLASAPVPVAEERLDPNPAQFTSLTAAELPPFASNQQLNETFVAQASTGPFGLGVRTLEEGTQGLEINLDVNAFNLPNLSKENDSVMLRITDIVDHQDKSLLADVGGCAGGIKQPANINMVYQGNAMANGQMISFTGLQGTKKILLPTGVALTSVGAIKGVISQQLPVEVERVNLNGPLAGKTLDLHGVQLRFLSAESNRLYFQVSGNTSALLQVNALNEDGKVLATTNSMRGDNFFDNGKTISIDYQGKIAAAEVVVASKLESKNYDFSIARLFPPAKPFLIEKSDGSPLAATSLSALEKESPPNDVIYPYQSPKQTIAAGPALIALNELNLNGQQFSLLADIYTRNTHPLAGQLSAVRMVISEIEDSSGNLHEVNHQAPIAMEHMGGGWVNGKFEPDPSKPWLRGQLELRDRPLVQSDAVAFWGKLVFLAAEDPISVKVPFQFGMPWNSNDGNLKLRRWEAGRLVFDVEGNFPELMSVKALDDMGLVVSQPAEVRTSFGKNTIELDIKQIPETIEFNIPRTQNRKEFPFEIRVLQ